VTPEENRARVLRWQRENRDKARAKQRRYEARHRERRNARHVERDPVKHRARQAVKRALGRGELVRPDHCEQCGNGAGVDVAGRPLLHGHHSDYSKPLEVRWLCSECHGEEHAGVPA
jgi:hypothetical protein